MDYIDLLSLVRDLGRLDNIELYGYIVSRIPRPINLYSSCSLRENGYFVRMQVVGVNLKPYRSHLRQRGIVSDNDIYMVNGSVALYVNANHVLPDWYTVNGTLRFGSKTDKFYLTMFPFKKNGNDWLIDFNNLYTLDISNWSETSRIYQSIYKSIELGTVTVPDDVKALPKFEARKTQGVVTHQSCNPWMYNNQDREQNELDENSDNIVSNDSDIFEVIDRDTILPKDDMIAELRGELSHLNNERLKFIRTLKGLYAFKDEGVDSHIIYMTDALVRNFKRKPHNSASTGRALIKKYLSKFGRYGRKRYLGKRVSTYLMDSFSEVASFIKDYNYEVDLYGDAWNLCKKAFGNREYFYANMLGLILGIDTDKLGDCCESLNDRGISFVKLVTSNPYLLLLIDSEFSYSEVDHIAYCLGLSNNKSIEEYKLVGILYDHLTNSSCGDTTYRYDKVLSSQIGTTLTEVKYNQCMDRGTYLTDSVKYNTRYYIDDIKDEVYLLPSTGWRHNGYNRVLPLSRSEIDFGLKSAIKYGLVLNYTIDNEEWVTSTKLLEKELFICEKAYELSNVKMGYDHDQIDKLIDEYEEMVGFKLEAKQREAVHLIDNGIFIITGSAGSGKTTVSDCMVFVNERMGVSDIQYATPTGKSAKRLQEVVKKPVQTFNSKFKITSGSTSLFDDKDDDSASEGVFYIFDEVAMPNINLIYSVFKKLGNCQVAMLGDISQLPPIGKGLPFKDMLRFLPCVKLLVTKRSAENSGITYNSKIINEHSEQNGMLPLKEFDDFKIIPCGEDAIQRVTVLLCKYHLGKADTNEVSELCNLLGRTEDDLIDIDGLTPDDIQVVTPLGKATYKWGSYQLNNELQKIFNDTRGYSNTFKHQLSKTSVGTKFRINDRVIHTDSNMYSMQWYSSYENGVFQKRYGYGVFNGDVGKIVGFFPSEMCEILDEDESTLPPDFQYPDALRDDYSFISEDHYFVVVEYYDPMSDSNYYILYRAPVNKYIESPESNVFNGDDLGKLALFYAGTTHKMQGSQSKLIISIVGKVNFSGFITRNMLYTEITRASEGEYLLGSVSNARNSQLTIARGIVASEGISTTLGLIYR